MNPYFYPALVTIQLEVGRSLADHALRKPSTDRNRVKDHQSVGSWFEITLKKGLLDPDSWDENIEELLPYSCKHFVYRKSADN